MGYSGRGSMGSLGLVLEVFIKADSHAFPSRMMSQSEWHQDYFSYHASDSYTVGSATQPSCLPFSLTSLLLLLCFPRPPFSCPFTLFSVFSVPVLIRFDGIGDLDQSSCSCSFLLRHSKSSSQCSQSLVVCSHGLVDLTVFVVPVAFSDNIISFLSLQ